PKRGTAQGEEERLCEAEGEGAEPAEDRQEGQGVKEKGPLLAASGSREEIIETLGYPEAEDQIEGGGDQKELFEGAVIGDRERPRQNDGDEESDTCREGARGHEGPDARPPATGYGHLAQAPEKRCSEGSLCPSAWMPPPRP